MAVRYIQVQTFSNLFSPAVRAYGNIAIIGATTPPPPATTPATTPSTTPATTPSTTPATTSSTTPATTPAAYTTFTDPNTAVKTYPGDLGSAIQLAFQQTPGPTIIYGIPLNPDWATAFQTASTLPVQLVVLANTPVNANNLADGSSTPPGGPLWQLINHVKTISDQVDGKERIGVAMLPKGSTDFSLITGFAANERMVYIAHKSPQDAAAAVAGTIAGYEPPVSLLLKRVNITTDLFTPTEIVTLNGPETLTSGPAGLGVNWLTSPALLPGGAIYMGEGYTGNPGGGKKFIDIVRTIDDISFKLKARLIQSIGVLRISRAGLRTVIGLLESVLEPYVRSDVLGSYTIQIPILVILDKDPIVRTSTEQQTLTNAQANRLIEVQVSVKYQAAIHRLLITLKLD